MSKMVKKRSRSRRRSRSRSRSRRRYVRGAHVKIVKGNLKGLQGIIRSGRSLDGYYYVKLSNPGIKQVLGFKSEELKQIR